MAEVLIVKRILLCVQGHEVEGCADLVDDRDAIVAFKTAKVVVVDLDDEVDLAGFKGDGP